MGNTSRSRDNLKNFSAKFLRRKPAGQRPSGSSTFLETISSHLPMLRQQGVKDITNTTRGDTPYSHQLYNCHCERAVEPEYSNITSNQSQITEDTREVITWGYPAG